MPKIDTKVEDYPVVDYFDDLYNPKTETVGEYLNRLERMYFHGYDKKTKRGIKGWDKFNTTLRNDLREAIRGRALDKAGIKWNVEPFHYKKSGKTIDRLVMRDQKGRFLGYRKIEETPIREPPHREVSRE